MGQPNEGDIVRCTVVSQHPWGVIVDIEGFPEVAASIDMFEAGLGSADRSDYPAPGTPLEAVVAQRRPHGRTNFYLRLSHLPEHIEHARRTGVAYPRQLDRPRQQAETGQAPDGQ